MKAYSLYINNYKTLCKQDAKSIDNNSLKPLLRIINKTCKSRAQLFFHIIEIKDTKTILYIRNFSHQ